MGNATIKTVAFLSYAHLDDTNSLSEITIFHDRLQSELRIQTGLPVEIFFDRRSIGWGKKWSEIINSNIGSVPFFIPILTPAFFQSKACRKEFAEFANAEKLRGRRDLILPIYYVRAREMTLSSGIDGLVDDVLSRQYRDWRNLRHKSRESTEILQEFAELAASMADTFFDLQIASELPIKNQQSKLEKDKIIIEESETILDRKLNYENLVLYSISEYPDLPVSQEWMRALLSDVNSDRYKTIRDIDREIKFARQKVLEYKILSPHLFKSSTDYITKSLIFVDSDFRNTHSVSHETWNAAENAGITRY